MKTEKEKELNRKMVLDYTVKKSKEKVREGFDTNKEFIHCGDFQSMLVKNNNLIFKLTNSIVKLYVLSDKMFKVDMFKYPRDKNNSEEEREKFFKEVCKIDFKASVSVYKKQWDTPKFSIREIENKVFISTGVIGIEINKKPFNIKYLHDEIIINEDFELKGMGSFGEGVCVYKKLDKSEHFYGFGEKTGELDKRTRDTIQWNTDNPGEHNDETKSLYCCIPFFVGLRNKRAYGIYFDSTYKTYFNMGKENSDYYYFAADNGELTYYFIYGPSIKEVIEGYTQITGRMKMPPMWALGYQQCRWSYYPQSKVLELAKTFREKNIPCDAIYLDIDYMDGFRVFTWDKERFPNSKAMLDELHNIGFKLVTIIDPGVKVDENYKVYDEGAKNDYFLKNCDGNILNGKVWPMNSAFPDFSNSKVRRWWGDLNAELIKQGVDGIWNDMNEPSLFDTKSGTLPKDVVHNSDEGIMLHEEFHNLYGMMEDKATFRGIKNAFQDKRIFILSRSGFAGVQRYSALWTGDNQSLWQHIKLSIPMNCNLGLSGVSFIGNDIGGFGGNCTPELLARWTQLGTFIPLFRNHSAIDTANQEPWAFNKKIEDICKKYIKLRYELLPYIYNLFYDSVKYGEPILRPLIYEFQEDDAVTNINDEFMFGSNMLIAPILEEGGKEREVYLPQGNWINYHTKEQYRGCNTINVSAPIEIIPIFIKAGTVIPKYKSAECTKNIDKSSLILDIIPNINSRTEYKYYEDDGESFNYENGEYNITNFVLEEDACKYILKVERIYKGYKNSFDKLYVNIINSIEPKKIKAIYKEEDLSSNIPFKYSDKTISFNIKGRNNFYIEMEK